MWHKHPAFMPSGKMQLTLNEMGMVIKRWYWQCCAYMMWFVKWFDCALHVRICVSVELLCCFVPVCNSCLVVVLRNDSL